VPDYVQSEPGERTRQRASEEGGEANLSKPSVVNVSQILTVDKAELVECIGKLSGAAAGAVRDGLHLLFDRL